VRPLPPAVIEVRSFSGHPAFVVAAADSATLNVADGLAIHATSWSGATRSCFITDGLPHSVRCPVEGGRVPALIQFTTVTAAPPPGTVPIPGSAAVPPQSRIRFFGWPPLPGAGTSYNIEVISETDQPAIATYDGMTLTLEVPDDFAVQLISVTALGVDECPAYPDAPQHVTCRLSPHPPAEIIFTAVPVPPEGVAEAVLDLTAPCIPEAGRRWCDGFRLRLWRGDPVVWANVRGVTDPEARFNETVLMRAQAGDPATISALARILGTPYVKVTRIRFRHDEFVEVTNLGGGSQDMTGWLLRSPARDHSFSLPPTVLQPDDRCTLYTGPARTDPVGICQWFTGTRTSPIGGWWPDDAGEVVLIAEGVALLADVAAYRAEPANQPPPPNLRLSAATVTAGSLTTP
jgi:hypothetical protein